jgi:hypothetical protein
MAEDQPTRPGPTGPQPPGPQAPGPQPTSGPPVWPDPYPPGLYASAPYPTGPYAAGFPPPNQPPQTVPLPGVSPVSGTTPLPVPISDPGEPVIAQIGDIEITATTVRTPVGVFPLRGSQWQVTDQWMTSQKIPTWAIVCAVAGFFCLTVFSLLFLLARETVYTGVVLVSVRSGPHQYDTRMAVTDQSQLQHVHSLVNYARSLAAV